MFIYSKIGLGPLKFEKDPLKFQKRVPGTLSIDPYGKHWCVCVCVCTESRTEIEINKDINKTMKKEIHY